MLNYMHKLLEEQDCECVRCGRTLTDLDSIKREIGPQCLKKAQEACRDFIKFDWEILDNFLEVSQYWGCFDDQCRWCSLGIDHEECESEDAALNHYTGITVRCPCGGDFESADLWAYKSHGFKKTEEHARELWERNDWRDSDTCNECGVNYFELDADEKGFRYIIDTDELMEVYHDGVKSWKKRWDND